MNISAIIVAAGQGQRAGRDIPKQYSLLGGRRVLAWSVDALARAGVADIVVVIDPAHIEHFRAATALAGPVRTVPGGLTRTQSVRNGLAAIEAADIILVHDAARPGVSPEIVSRLVGAIETGAVGAAPALAVPDTLRRVGENGRVLEDIDRAGVMRVQTPQAFRASALRAAYDALPADVVLPDDLAVVRAHGRETMLIPGEERLMKLTYPEDRAMLEGLLAGDSITVVGNGFDAHRFGPGDYVTLCGVKIEHSKGLVGHSDADAGWHALVDAILGALSLGDIGAHFPPGDPQWKGAESERFLRFAAKLANDAGARIVHADITLVCERPKIGPHRDVMRARTADVLGLPIDRVSVKATTTERMGFTGREEGLMAQATATVQRPA